VTREELLKLLDSLVGVDPEWAHCEADDALLAFIDDDDIRAAFEAITRWYS
jgi:hypothetical protein